MTVQVDEGPEQSIRAALRSRRDGKEFLEPWGKFPVCALFLSRFFHPTDRLPDSVASHMLNTILPPNTEKASIH